MKGENSHVSTGRLLGCSMIKNMGNPEWFPLITTRQLFCPLHDKPHLMIKKFNFEKSYHYEIKTFLCDQSIWGLYRIGSFFTGADLTDCSFGESVLSIIGSVMSIRSTMVLGASIVSDDLVLLDGGVSLTRKVRLGELIVDERNLVREPRDLDKSSLYTLHGYFGSPSRQKHWNGGLKVRPITMIGKSNMVENYRFGGMVQNG